VEGSLLYWRKRMDKTLGQIAYEAYCMSVNNLSFTGVVLPEWGGSTDNIRAAWEEAAKAVLIAGCEHDIYQCEGVSWHYMQRDKEQK
jgi:hypothetical protein